MVCATSSTRNAEPDRAVAMKSFVSVDELSVEFKTRNGLVEALQSVSLTLDKGEILGVVGESGSGKSVTAYSMLGLLGLSGRIKSGSVDYDGVALSEASERHLQEIRGREISMIFQNPRGALNPIRPVGKQIEDVLLRHAQATHAMARGRAIELLDKVRIINPEQRYWSLPYELSGEACANA